MGKEILYTEEVVETTQWMGRKFKPHRIYIASVGCEVFPKVFGLPPIEHTHIKVLNWENSHEDNHDIIFVTEIKNKKIIKSDLSDEEIIKKEKGLYEKNKMDYMLKFEGKYIAQIDGKVIDSDVNFSDLTQRVYEKLGYITIFITRVLKNEKQYRIPSLRLKRE